MSYYLANAEHNEKACKCILAANQFNDWVITTAFYSAMHYVYHEIFPLTIGHRTYADFADYAKSTNSRRLSPHTKTANLVAQQIPSCRGEYNWLKSECWNVRYKNFLVQDGKKLAALAKLEKIKSCLSKLTRPTPSA